MRRILIGSIAVLALLVPATPATAAPPEVTHPEAFEVVIPFPDVCPDFPMFATVSGRTHAVSFVDSDGNLIRGWAGGQLFVTWTRTDNGHSRTFAISGPTFFDANGDAIRGTGRWTTPIAGTGWALVIGHLTLDGVEDGFPRVVAIEGRSTSICELMA